MIQKRLYIGFLLCCMMAAFQSCVTEAPAPPPKELKLGDSTISNTIQVPVAGGTFFFNAGDTANSARIVFPSNSYTSVKTVTLTVTPIKGSSFGDNIHTETPLYTIDAGTEFCNKDIIINIPYVPDTNNFSMGFFYDLVSHELEGVPTVGYDAKSKLKLFSVTTRRSGSIFISSIPLNKLGMSASSSFEPAKDNWEFPNFGTTMTPTGQFAGQNLSALWYYYEKTLKGSPHLYGTYDVDHGGEKPKIWQDNDLGFRVAAETQNILNWNSYAPAMIAPLDNGNALLTSRQVLYATLVTGKPQIITVIKDSVVLPLTVFAVANSIFAVADPNFPITNGRIFSISSNTYKTGISYDDAISGKNVFAHATYIGVRAMIDWEKITKVWSDAQNNIFTTFPPYDISFSDAFGNLIPTAKGFLTLSDTIALNFSGNQPAITRVYANDNFSAYETSNHIALKSGTNHLSIYTLNLASDGVSTLWAGFRSYTVEQQRFAITPAIDSGFIENDIILRAFMAIKPPGSLRFEWDMGDGSPVITKMDIDNISYRYTKRGTFTVKLTIYNNGVLLGSETSQVTVDYLPASITPSPLIGGLNYSPMLHAIITNKPGNLSLRYLWNFGDGTQTVVKENIDSIQHTFNNAGTYLVKLQVFDIAKNIQVVEATDSCTVMPFQLSASMFAGMKFVSVNFRADNVYNGYAFHGFPSWSYNGGTASDTSQERLIWDGSKFQSSHSFSANSSYHNSDFDYGNSSQNIGGIIKGEISADGSNVLSISFGNSYSDHEFSAYTSSQSGHDEWESQDFTVMLIPIYKIKSSDSIIFEYAGSSLKDLVKSISWKYSEDWYPISHGYYANYVSTNWDNTSLIPSVTVVFSK